MLVRTLLAMTFAIGALAQAEKPSQREELNHNTYESRILLGKVRDAFSKDPIVMMISEKARTESAQCSGTWAGYYRIKSELEVVHIKYNISCWRKGVPNEFKGGQQIDFLASVNERSEVTFKSIRFTPDIRDQRAGLESYQQFAGCGPNGC